MIRVRDLIGLPVLLHGQRIGAVEGAVYDPALTRLHGLVTRCLSRGLRLIAANEIALIGEMSVLVRSGGVRARENPRLLRRVLTADGALYGAAIGAALSERTLDVEALEITRGFWEDCRAGRVWLYRYVVRADSGDILPIEEEGGEGE